MITKTQQAINDTVDLFNQELQNDELLQEELDEQNARLRSNTQICEEEGYLFTPGKKMPQTFQCGGSRNAGKYMRVDYDGYIKPMSGGGGSGYEPDFTTIALTSNNELAVIDYISSTEANNLIYANVEITEPAQQLETIEIKGTKYTIGGGEGGYEPDFQTIGLTSNTTLGVLDYVSKTYVDSKTQPLYHHIIRFNARGYGVIITLDSRTEHIDTPQLIMSNIFGIKYAIGKQTDEQFTHITHIVFLEN